MAETRRNGVDRFLQNWANTCIILTTAAAILIGVRLNSLYQEVQAITAKMTDVVDATSGKLVESIKDVDAGEVGGALTTKAKEMIRDYGRDKD